MSVLPSHWYETPDLHGDHVTLSQLRPHHAAGVLAAADDNEVFRWLSHTRPTTLAEAEALVHTYLTTENMDAWAQFDMASGELAGLTTYYDIDPTLRSLAIGHTWLGKRHHRTAINTEAKLLLLQHAFEGLHAVRVVWHTDIYNEQSQESIERLGATREGVLRKHRIRRDGSWRDTVQFAMTDDDWPAVRERLAERLAARSGQG